MTITASTDRSSAGKINCSKCISGIHDSCLDETKCLCAHDDHGNKKQQQQPSMIRSLDDVSLLDMHQRPEGEPQLDEQQLRDAARLWQIKNDDMGGNTPPYVLYEYVKLLILSDQMVSKFDLIKELRPWCEKHRIVPDDTDIAISSIFSDVDMIPAIKGICNMLGRNGTDVIFDTTQIFEAAEWIKGKYHIKRIELTGDLLFFNGCCYQNETKAIIQRAVRECVAAAKSKDVNEIVKYIEDTCPLIKWKDIECSIHLKCMLNGIYDIKTGIFSNRFDPDYIILNQIPHNFDESKSYDEIDKIVTSIIPNDNARQSYYDFISTCFHPYTGIDYQFGMVGGTGTGKSQLGVLAEMAVGPDNVGDATIHLISKDQTTQKNMAFKMLNIDYDLNSDSIKQIDVIKKWITQDKFTARGIYEQSTSFRPMSRLMFMANDLYEISNSDDSEAIYDRTYIIRVDKKYRHQQQEVKRVMEKTATPDQLEGFVTYCLKNATWIYNNESYHHIISVADVESIWNTYGNRIKMFIEKWIERGVSYRTESSEPFNKWMSYCMSYDYKTKDKKQFSAIFNDIIGNTPTKTRIDNIECYAYSGFRIKTDEEVAKYETSPLVPLTDNKSSKSSVNIIPFTEFQKIFEILKNTKKEQSF